MQSYRFLRWFIPVTVGVGLLFPAATAALGLVHYTPSSTFTLNVTAGNSNQDFGTVHVQSESPTGWILKVRSTQGGTLRHDTSAYTIPYVLTIDGDVVSPLAGGNDVTIRTTSTLTCAPPTGCNLPVRATIVASDIQSRPAGPYLDTLVFTLISQ